MDTSTLSGPLLIAVDDPALHPEALQAAAATGRPVVDADSPETLRRHFARAHAVLLDAPFATAASDLPARAGVFLLGGDVATIADQHARFPQAAASFVLPAQAGELLRAVGSLRSALPASRGAEAVIAVVGAAGGVGTSTLAATICRAAGSEREPTLIDAHRYSGGLDFLLGIEDEIGARWGEIVVGEGAVDRADVRRALPSSADGIAVLTHARTTIADPFVVGRHDVERLVAAVAGAGLTVVDAPVNLVPSGCDLVVVVTPAEVRGVAAAARVVAELAAGGATTAVALRHRGWSSLDREEAERIVRAPVIAEIRQAGRLTRTVEVAGLPTRLPRTLANAARQILSEAGL
ncbi:septum site-determining protein Ssd [Corynebacterium sp. LK2510]|uniref:septum site-determining protein Ssd n=1 Tax=Corynebacterium sp. LK2510 TaxID=3110472 RepID=UPI0034CE2298